MKLLIRIIAEIWSCMNTLVSWIATRVAYKEDVIEREWVTIYVSEESPTNYGFGPFVVARYEDIDHEYAHGIWSRILGPLYHWPVWFGLYLLFRWEPVSVIEFLIVSVGLIIWYFVILEWLANKIK